MSSRSRDTGRHYASGSAKRKAKDEKEKKNEAVLSKTRKLFDFFNVQSDVAESTENKAKHTEVASHCTYNSGTTTVSNETTFSTSDAVAEETAIPSNLVISCSSQREVKSTASTLDPEPSCSSQKAVDGILLHDFTTVSSLKQNESKIYSNDIGEWPSNFDRDYWIAKGSSELQHMDSDFLSSKKIYEKENKPRFCQKSFFSYKHKLTNKTHVRDWLCYSETKGRLFCFVCKVTNSDTSSPRFTKDGLDDWKNAHNLLTRHEESTPHGQAIISLVNLKNKNTRVDSQLVSQIETEQNYWRLLLKRIIAVIKFLAERGLAFRGSDEIVGSPHNGNYLGLLELIAQFDAFMAQHIQSYANKGKGHTSYLSKTTCEEFIHLIASSILDQIICEIKRCKYYSVSLDSTPDISHVDQLTLIVRYVLPSGPVERFVKFLDMEGHTAEQLAQSLLDFLSESDIDIKDCRGQSYDNASNMSGKYCGLQARIKEINKYAEYIPCLAHSLNLVAKCAADCCTEALLFFDFVENLYTFFSASTYRWSRLTNALKDSTSKIPILKRLSDTRWSARADATKALLCGFITIKQVLEDIFNNVDQKAECRNKAYGLVSTMNKLETGIMTIMWNRILERLQATSASLQSSDQDLNTGYALYETVYAYVQAMRSTFSDVEAKAKDLTDCEEYQQQTSRRSKRNTKYDHFTGSTTLDNFVENQTPGQRFEIQVFIVIIDNVLSALTKRMEAYHEITGVFGIFRQLKSLTTEEILENASRMVSAYEDDLESSLGDELVQFAELLKTDVATVIDSKKQESLELQFYKLLLNNSLESCFPNVEIALRIYLSLMITNCSGERSFSTLKRIKNELRNTMGQERLNHLTLMNIEYNLLKEVDSESVISKFAHIKCRKVYL